MGYTYVCPTRLAARRSRIASEVAALREEGRAKGFSAELLDRLYEKQNEVQIRTDRDHWPALEGKKCRWLTDIHPSEKVSEGVIETLEPIPGLTPSEPYDIVHNIQHWFLPDGSIEQDPRCRIKPVPMGHLVKNHGAGRMTAAEVRDIAAGIYEKLASKSAAEQNAAARLRMLMDEEPLGLALEADKAADWASDVMAVTEGPVPQVLEKALLARYGYEKSPESLALESESISAKYATLDKIPGWTPQNAYVGTRKDYYYTTFVELESWEDNTKKHARTFTVTSATFNLGALGICLTKGQAAMTSGVILCKLYAGTPAAPGALLSTSEISIAEVSSNAVVEYNFHPFAGIGNPQLANGSTYFFELSTTIALSSQDHIHILGKATDGVAGDQNWTYTTGGGWVSNVKKQGFYTTDCSSGGRYQVRTDVATSVLLAATGPKGALGDITDGIDVFCGATVTFDDSRSINTVRLGEAKTKYDLTGGTTGPEAAMRYGFVIFGAGIQVNWNTGGGVICNVTGAGTATKQDGITISGTSGSRTVFTNKTDAVVWADDYGFAGMYYLGYLSCGYYTLRANMGGTAFWAGLGYSAYSDIAEYNLGWCRVTGPFSNLAAQSFRTIFTMPDVSLVTKDLTIEELEFDATGATKAHTLTLGTGTFTNGMTGMLLFKNIWIKQTATGDSGNCCKLSPGTVCMNAPLNSTSQYMRAHYIEAAEQTTQQGPPAVPTWPVSIFDNATGKTLYGTISNPNDYNDAAVFEVARSDTLAVIGRFTKAEYVAAGNKFYTWPVLTDGVEVAVKLRTTVDFLLYSDWSTESNSATPSHSGYDWPARGEVWEEATVDGQDGLRVDADPDLVLQGSSSFGDPASPLVPNYPALTAQNVRDAMKLAPSAGAPAEGSIDEAVAVAAAAAAEVDGRLPESPASEGNVSAVGAIALSTNRVLRNRLAIDKNTGIMTIYADDGLTPLYTAQLTDKDGNAAVLIGTGPANRAALA